MALAGVGSIEPGEGMAALESLLAGPVDQVAFLKGLGPWTGRRTGRIGHRLPRAGPLMHRHAMGTAGLRPLAGPETGR